MSVFFSQAKPVYYSLRSEAESVYQGIFYFFFDGTLLAGATRPEMVILIGFHD
jgi:hypothetical protein